MMTVQILNIFQFSHPQGPQGPPGAGGPPGLNGCDGLNVSGCTDLF